jgi:hypothetical protein
VVLINKHTLSDIDLQEFLAHVGTEYTRGKPRAYVQVNPIDIHTPNTLEPGQSQHDSSAACVIAQQYSSSIFVSPSFLFAQRYNCGALFKNVISFF